MFSMETKELFKDINEFHYKIEKEPCILNIPNEIRDSKKQFLEVNKAEDFFDRLLKHFENEEVILYTLVDLNKEYANDVNTITSHHNIILEKIEDFNKIIYGNIFPLNNEDVNKLNSVIPDLNYLITEHILFEEKFFSIVFGSKIDLLNKIEVDKDINVAIEILKILMRSEILLAKYYNLAATKFEEDREFFLSIAKQEVENFQNIKKMINIVIRNQKNFLRNEAFKKEAAELFLKGVESIVSLMEKENWDKIKFISVALDYEKSIMENKYSNILKTDSLEYNFLLREIEKATQSHILALEDKFKKYKELIK